MNTYEKYRLGNDLLIDIVLGEDSTHSLADVDWECAFYTDHHHRLVVPKANAHNIDDGHYLCPVSTGELSEGLLYADLRLKIPDTHFEAGYKVEIIPVALPKIYLER